MFFKQILHEDSGCASYFLASRKSRESAVIDPFLEGGYLDIAKERGYHTFYVIDTALHADHGSGNRRLAMTSGGKVYVHEAAEVKYRFEALKDAQVITMGEVQLKVVHTGPQSLAIVVTDTDRGSEPALVLSGDALFIGNADHPDLTAPAGVEHEFEAIQKLLQLPDYLEVFPAHVLGTTQKSECGRSSSTIGYERRYNPVLKLSKDEFLKLSGRKHPRALNQTVLDEMNRGIKDYRWARPMPTTEASAVNAEEVSPWIQENKPLIVDVREPEEFAAGHLPGAVNIPQADLGIRIEEVPADKPVLVLDTAGGRSPRAASFLVTNGRTNVMYLAGGSYAWKSAGNSLIS